MRIERPNMNEVIIIGNIKTVEDSIEIKNTVSNMVGGGSKNITLYIKDSLSLTSTVIGYFIKLVHHEKIKLSLVVGDSRLYTLLDELSLVQQFNVRLAKQ